MENAIKFQDKEPVEVVIEVERNWGAVVDEDCKGLTFSKEELGVLVEVDIPKGARAHITPTSVDNDGVVVIENLGAVRMNADHLRPVRLIYKLDQGDEITLRTENALIDISAREYDNQIIVTKEWDFSYSIHHQQYNEDHSLFIEI